MIPTSGRGICRGAVMRLLRSSNLFCSGRQVPAVLVDRPDAAQAHVADDVLVSFRRARMRASMASGIPVGKQLAPFEILSDTALCVGAIGQIRHLVADRIVQVE